MSRLRPPGASRRRLTGTGAVRSVTPAPAVPRAASPRLDKGLGQHHLRRPELCGPLIEYLQPAGRLVVEVGPGGGVLTAALLAAGARVYGVELDLAWAVRLRRSLRAPALGLAVGDALRCDWGRLPAGALIAGNLPYAIATALLEQLLEPRSGLTRAGFLVQYEVAQRWLAAPGDAAYGSLSVIVQAAAECRWLGRVRPGSFRPPPRVESAFVGLLRRERAVSDEEWAGFKATVRAAFRGRRKTIVNSLAQSWGKTLAKEALVSAGIDARARAETLPVASLVGLYRAHRSLEQRIALGAQLVPKL